MTVADLFGINWATPFLLLAGYGVFRYFTAPAAKTEKPGKITWTPLESVSVTLALYFASQFIGTVLLFALARIFSPSSTAALDWLQDSSLGQFLFVIVIDALMTALLIIFLRRRKASLKTIGFFGKPSWRDAGYSLLGLGIYFALYFVAFVIIQNLITSVDVGQQQQIGFDNAHSASLILVFLSLVILPAFVEEIVVRGFLYTGLKNGLPRYAAVIVTSVLFGLAHLQAGSGAKLLWIAAVDTFILSLVLIYLKEKTGRLWASIGLHMLKNAITFLALFVFHLG